MLKLFKLAKKETKQSFQLSNLIEILQDSVCITYSTGELIYINKAAYSLLSIHKNSDISEINFLEKCIRDESEISFLKNEIDQQGFVRNHELKLYNMNGDLLDVILSVNLIGDFSQQSIGFLFLIKDVTELKKIQQQLLQSQKLESIGLMASGIAHDFNNILAAIIPNSELIKYSSHKNDANYKRAEIIEKSAHRASDIAQRLLTFTRHRDQQFNEPVDLNQIVSDSLELLAHSVSSKVHITRQLDENLPLVKGDESQLQQIILNLVLNANDAMPEGGTIHLKTEKIHIEGYYQIGSLEPGDYVHLSVRDTGVGIPIEVISKIFDPFFTTKEIGKGTGLGLSVVYGIVKSLKGYIDVDSKTYQGTTFHLYFPAIPLEVQPKTKQEIKEVNPSNLKMLLVDDEDYVLNILGDIMEFLGYQVVKQRNGQDAVDYFRDHSSEIDYVIVDLKMPKMDGRATSTKLRDIDPNVKIIFTSGFDDSPMNKKDFEGVVGYLKKPYSINQVTNTLERIVKGNGLS